MARDAGPAQRDRWKWLKRLWAIVYEHWFLLGLGVAVGLAAAYPELGKKYGLIAAQYTISFGAVIVMFILTGMSLQTKVLLTAATRWRLHLMTQCVSLGLIPAVGYCIVLALRLTAMNSYLLDGVVIASSMPTTVSTNTVFTKMAGGNEPAAVVGAVVGNVLGIFISPLLIAGFLGQSGAAPYNKVFFVLGVTVIAPLVVGQLIQFFLPKVVVWLKSKVNFNVISSIMVLLLVYGTFCTTFANPPHVSAGSVVVIVFLVGCLYIAFSLVCLVIATIPVIKPILGLDRSDAIAVAMVGATKTVAIGVPMINVIYGDSPYIGLLTTPLLLYHAEQILIGSLSIKPLKRWQMKDPLLQAPPKEDGQLDEEAVDIGRPAENGTLQVNALDPELGQDHKAMENRHGSVRVDTAEVLTDPAAEQLQNGLADLRNLPQHKHP